jgi:hypothetical protein
MGTVTVGPHQNERCSDDCVVIVVFFRDFQDLSYILCDFILQHWQFVLLVFFYIVYMCF